MGKRVAQEWLWLLAEGIAAMGVSLVYRGVWWTVGETGVAFASLYGTSAVMRTTIWAIRTARTPAAA